MIEVNLGGHKAEGTGAGGAMSVNGVNLEHDVTGGVKLAVSVKR